MAQTYSGDQMQALFTLLKNEIRGEMQAMMTVMKDEIRGEMQAVIQPLIQKLDKIDSRFDGIESRLNNVEINVALSNNKLAMLLSKSLNATLDSDSTVAKVPLMNGGDPLSEYPRCIYSLVVAGNEKLPDDSQNTWNAGKSLALIREYDPGYETDGNDSYGSARKRRMVLATHLGVTPYQLNTAAIVYYS